MPRLGRTEREAIATERILRLLDRHGVATMRIIEQKIADAGPFNQRINPHILTSVRNDLLKSGRVARLNAAGTSWYYATDTDPTFREQRLALLAPIHQRGTAQAFTKRVGDALEIAVYRALYQADADFHGRFRDLDDHDDFIPYSKEEPPSHIGRHQQVGDLKLDFHYRHPTAGWAGLECKNLREWIYPNRSEVRELITKSFALDCVPVLVARRIHPSTVFVFGRCGLVVHQNYNQLAPAADPDLIENLTHKDRMGYFDIRATNQPNLRMTRFIANSLVEALPAARAKWRSHADLIERYATDPDMTYEEFAGRVGRRARGEPEDGFSPPPVDPHDYT